MLHRVNRGASPRRGRGHYVNRTAGPRGVKGGGRALITGANPLFYLELPRVQRPSEPSQAIPSPSVASALPPARPRQLPSGWHQGRPYSSAQARGHLPRHAGTHPSSDRSRFRLSAGPPVTPAPPDNRDDSFRRHEGMNPSFHHPAAVKIARSCGNHSPARR
jgi:hypothetical protein